MIIDDLKLLLKLDQDSNVDVLNIYIRRAITFVRNYINDSTLEDIFIEANYADAIVMLVYNSYISKGTENVQSMSQGARSITYKNDSSGFTINSEIKTLLPLPHVRMRG